MNKILKIIMVTIVLCIYFSNAAFAKFEKINAEEANKIYITQRNKDKLPFDKHFSIKLQDGNYLIIESYHPFSLLWDDTISDLIQEKLKREYFLKFNKPSMVNTVLYKEFPQTKAEKDGFKNYIDKYFEKYMTLSEEEKEKIYLPLLKNNKHYYNKYLYIKEREKKVEHAQIYNPKTKEFKIVGKRTIQGQINYKYKTLLKNGNVLLVYEKPLIIDYPENVQTKFEFEVYNTQTETFQKLKDLDNVKIIHIFDDGEILLNIVNQNKTLKTSIYNIYNGHFTDLENTIENPHSKHIKLTDGRLLIFNRKENKTYHIVYFDHKNNSIKKSKYDICGILYTPYHEQENFVYFLSKKEIYKLDTQNDLFEKIGEIKIPTSGNTTKFINNSIFIYNKYNYSFDGSISSNTAIEIFNVKTKKTTIKKFLKLANIDTQWAVIPLKENKVLLYLKEDKKGFIYTED